MTFPRLFLLGLAIWLLAPILPVAGQPSDCTNPGTPCPAVSVTASTQQVTEASGKITFTLTRNPVFVPPTLTVRFEMRGNATNGTDYTVSPSVTGAPAQGQVTFDVGEATATVEVTPKFDLDDENGLWENVTLAILQGTDYNVVEPAMATASIHDYAHSTVSVIADDAVMVEGNPQAANPGRFMVSRNVGSDRTGDLTVRVRVEGTANQVSPAEYTTSPSLAKNTDLTVKIDANKWSTNVTVTPVDDTVQDPVRTIVLSVLNPPADPKTPATHYAISASAASATISLDDDDRPSVSIVATDAVATEAGGTSTTGTSATFTLSRTSTLDTIQVNVLLGGTAIADDYGITGVSSNQVTMAAGVATATVTVTAVNDTVQEPGNPETVILAIAASTGNTYNVGNPSSATVTIEDNDSQTVNVTASDASAAEAGSNPGTVTFKRTGPGATTALQVLYTITGTANATGTQRDYNVAGGIPNAGCTATAPCKFNFTANTGTATLVFTPIDDTRRESTETINVTLVVNGTQYGLGSPTLVTINLADDDTPALDSDSDGVPDVTDNCDNTPNGQTQTGPDARQNNTDADAFGDACDPDDDNDGLTDTAETTIHKTKTKVRDTDGDGRGDGDEVAANTKPLDRFSPEYRVSSVRTRATGAGIEVNWTAPTGSLATRYLVFRASTPTLLAEVPASSPSTYLDDEFPGDNESHKYHIQPMLPGDVGSAFNATLAGAGSDPVQMELCDVFPKDTDGDGLCDREEEDLGTDADKADSDGDGVSDPDEVEAGTDPLDPSSGEASRFDPLEVPFLAGVALALAALATLGVAIGLARRGKS